MSGTGSFQEQNPLPRPKSQSPHVLRGLDAALRNGWVARPPARPPAKSVLLLPQPRPPCRAAPPPAAATIAYLTSNDAVHAFSVCAQQPAANPPAKEQRRVSLPVSERASGRATRRDLQAGKGAGTGQGRHEQSYLFVDEPLDLVMTQLLLAAMHKCVLCSRPCF